MISKALQGLFPTQTPQWLSKDASQIMSIFCSRHPLISVKANIFTMAERPCRFWILLSLWHHLPLPFPCSLCSRHTGPLRSWEYPGTLHLRAWLFNLCEPLFPKITAWTPRMSPFQWGLPWPSYLTLENPFPRTFDPHSLLYFFAEHFFNMLIYFTYIYFVCCWFSHLKYKFHDSGIFCFLLIPSS